MNAVTPIASAAPASPLQPEALHRHLEEAARHAGPEIIPPGAAAPHRRAW